MRVEIEKVEEVTDEGDGRRKEGERRGKMVR